LNPEVAAEFSHRTGAVVVEGYGLSEASPVTHVGPLDGTARPGTIGLPLPDTDAMIVDAVTGIGPLPPGEVGELIVRGPQVMQGYWDDPEATAVALRDGWLYTGDLATCSADGFFRIVDRKKDLIITSGVNVYPTDVEHVLRQFDGVEDIAVLGVPDAARGELVKAVVVPKKGHNFSRRAFDDFARQHLEVHKRPRVVEVIAGPLPRNPLGKVLRRVFREQYLAGKIPSHDGALDGDGKPDAA
jgi:long-chain acyl-CoA synthetase